MERSGLRLEHFSFEMVYNTKNLYITSEAQGYLAGHQHCIVTQFSKHRTSGPMLSISLNVHMFVCLSVCRSVCSLLR